MVMRAASGVVVRHLVFAAIRLVGMCMSPHNDDRINRDQGDRNEGDQGSETAGHANLSDVLIVERDHFIKSLIAIKYE
jgi:hypothetical protein